MIIIRQKEFNSKAAKALNNKYLKELAEKKGIEVTANHPKIWKHDARIVNKLSQEYTHTPNAVINNKQMDKDRMKKLWKETNPNKYDHGNRIESNMTSKLDSEERNYVKGRLLKSKEAREAAKKA